MSNELEAKLQIYPEDGGFQLHKLTPDGVKGEAVGPNYPKRADALAYQRALYSHSPDATASEKDDVLTITSNGNVGLSNGTIPSQILHISENTDMTTTAKARDLPIEGNTPIEITAGVATDVTAPTSTMNLITGTVHFEADTDNPRFLRFKNAVLARPETNANRDNITADGVRELAETIAGTHIDLDHNTGKCVGAYTAGRVGDQGELRVDGIIWLDACAQLGIDPNDILDGRYGMSVEAEALVAECSTCHAIHTDAKSYCTHLKMKFKSGAERMLRGLKAIGGAFTMKPAGTNTGFVPGSLILIVASHQEEDAVDEAIEVEAVEKRADVSPADVKRAEDEYGDVEYGDEKNKKFPLDKAHIDAALSYWGMPKNRAKYSPEEQKTIGDKIRRAAKKFGIEVSDDKNQEQAMDEKEKKALEDEEKKETSEEEKKESAAKQKKEEEAGVEKKMKAEYDEMCKAMAEMTAKVETLSAENTTLKVSADTAKAEAEAVKSEKTALEAQMSEMKASLDTANVTIRANRVEALKAKLVGSVMDENKFTANIDTWLGLDEVVLETMVQAHKTEPQTSDNRLKLASSDYPAANIVYTY